MSHGAAMSASEHVEVLRRFAEDYKFRIPQFHAQNRKVMKQMLADLDAAIAALSAEPVGDADAVSDEQIESLIANAGGEWRDSTYLIEASDLFSFVRRLAQPQPQRQGEAEMRHCGTCKEPIRQNPITGTACACSPPTFDCPAGVKVSDKFYSRPASATITWQAITADNPPLGKMGPYIVTGGDFACIVQGRDSRGGLLEQMTGKQIPFVAERFVSLESVLTMLAAPAESAEVVALLTTLRDYFDRINHDDDGDNYMNLSCDAMDEIDRFLGDLAVPIDGAEVVYPECSGNPSDCPENEGYGFCKESALNEDRAATQEVERG